MYDSATPTALALRAYERANLQAQARRARLNQGYGLNDDGTMNSDTSGSIYQGNLNSVENEMAAENADRAHGFLGTGGLANRRGSRAHLAGLMTQSGMLRDAFGNIADTRQQEQDNKGAYEDTLTQIRSNSDADLAQTLAANPVQVPVSAPTPAAFNPQVAALTPAQAVAQRAALKRNPRVAQVARNNRY